MIERLLPSIFFRFLFCFLFLGPLAPLALLASEEETLTSPPSLAPSLKIIDAQGDFYSIDWSATLSWVWKVQEGEGPEGFPYAQLGLTLEVPEQFSLDPAHRPLSQNGTNWTLEMNSPKELFPVFFFNTQSGKRESLLLSAEIPPSPNLLAVHPNCLEINRDAPQKDPFPSQYFFGSLNCKRKEGQILVFVSYKLAEGPFFRKTQTFPESKPKEIPLAEAKDFPPDSENKKRTLPPKKWPPPQEQAQLRPLSSPLQVTLGGTFTSISLETPSTHWIAFRPFLELKKEYPGLGEGMLGLNFQLWAEKNSLSFSQKQFLFFGPSFRWKTAPLLSPVLGIFYGYLGAPSQKHHHFIFPRLGPRFDFPANWPVPFDQILLSGTPFSFFGGSFKNLSLQLHFRPAFSQGKGRIFLFGERYWTQNSIQMGQGGLGWNLQF